MSTLLGYMNMKEKHGKVLVLSAPIKNNGCGYTTFTKCVYDDVADSITEKSIGKDIRFTSGLEVV